MALFLSLDTSVSGFIYKISWALGLAEAGPCLVNCVFQEADRDVVRRARNLLGANSWEREGRKNW